MHKSTDITHVQYMHTQTNKLMKQCLEQWNLFGSTTKTSLRLDAWQALISSLPLRLLPSYHCFSHSSFLLLSVCRCARPQSCTLTPVSKRTGMYDKHRSSLFPLPHFHPTPSRKHQGPLQSQHVKEKRKTIRLSQYSRTVWQTMIYSIHRQSHKTVKQADIGFSRASITCFPWDKPYFRVESAHASSAPVGLSFSLSQRFSSLNNTCKVWLCNTFPKRSRLHHVNPKLLVQHVSVHRDGRDSKHEDWLLTTHTFLLLLHWTL